MSKWDKTGIRAYIEYVETGIKATHVFTMPEIAPEDFNYYEFDQSKITDYIEIPLETEPVEGTIKHKTVKINFGFNLPDITIDFQTMYWSPFYAHRQYNVILTGNSYVNNSSFSGAIDSQNESARFTFVKSTHDNKIYFVVGLRTDRNIKCFYQYSDIERYITEFLNRGGDFVLTGFPFEYSTEKGGDGTGDNTSDEIGFPDLPTDDILDANMISVYDLSKSKIQEFASYLWGSAGLHFDIDNFKKMFNNPMDAIISLHLVPNINLAPETDGTVIKVGNIETSITAKKVHKQFFTVDLGEIKIDEYYGSFMDYAPYTEILIFLPFIGYKELATSDCMGATLTLKYYVDILTGECTALIKCTKENNNAIKYQFSGNMSAEIPLSASDRTNWLKTLGATVVSGIGTAIAGATGNAPAAIASGTAFVGGAMSLTTGAIKESVERSGKCTGASGFMLSKQPYIIIVRPQLSAPEEYADKHGYPSNITVTLGDCTGFTQVQYIELEHIKLTDAEKEEIKTLLERGVIF